MNIKKLFLPLIYFFFLSLMNGQVVFEQNIVANSTDGIFRPSDLVSGDLDNDGLEDLIACSGNGKIFWFKNNGAGGFDEEMIVNEFLDNINNLIIADLDQNGHQDVISIGGDGILWHSNNGGGTFSWEQNIAPGILNDLGDLDGDGDLDILSSPFFSDQVVWYENLDGSNNFSDAQIIDNTQWVVNLSMEDLDNDGDLDVVGIPFNPSAADPSLIWYENIDGLGNFNEPVTILAPPFMVGTDLKFADIDNDGIKDLCSKTADNRISWRKKGLGVSDFGLLNTIDNPTDDISNYVLADTESDGDIDVYTLINEEVYLQKNINGSGNFTNRVLTSQNKKLLESLKFADLNGDGMVSLMYASDERNEIGWEEKMEGSEVFGITQYPIAPYADYPNSLFSTDMDNDGDLDLICASSNDNKISWYENTDGNGTFSDERLIDNCTKEADYVLSADIDGDNDQDVVASFGELGGSGFIVWYKNLDGLGYQWEADTAFTRNQSVYALEIADVDGDGDIDILGVCPSLMENQFWIENTDGNGSFSEPILIPEEQGFAFSLKAADIDNDGDMDLVAGGQNTLFWSENLDGLGSFSQGQMLSQSGNIGFVQTGDLDGDGDLDLIIAEGEAQKLSWFENIDGEGNFGVKQTVSASLREIRSIQVEDIDGDGDLDLITGATGTSNYRVVYFENLNGQGEFGVEQLVFEQIIHFGAPFVIAADFDGDNDIDIASAEQNRDRISWFENRGVLFNEIIGQVFLDLDGSGCDDSSSSLSDLIVTNTNNDPVFSSTNGYFQFIEQLSISTTTVMTPDFFDLTPLEHISEFTDYGIMDTVNFCLTPNQVVDDLNIVILPITEPRPGFEVDYKVVISNAGTTTLSGPAKFQYDSNVLSFVSSSDPNLILNNGELSFSFQDLVPFSKHEIDFRFLVAEPPTVNIDDQLILNASIDFTFNDINESDNEFLFEQLVIGSFDPNDITVLEGPEIYLEEADDYLHYLVRFQNTGTASAMNVRIENSLDPKLNWETMQLDAYSHSNVTSIINENQIVFNFEDINLPDSTTNESASNGFIAYKIKPISSVDAGDIFLNNANIFFDFNQPILTNTVSTEIVLFINTNEAEYSNFEIFPVPSGNNLYVKGEMEIISISILDGFGQILINNQGNEKIDVSMLSSGVYYCKIVDRNGQNYIRKIIKH